MSELRSFVAKIVKQCLNEQKITPDYLKVDQPYIDKDGNIIGANTYKSNNYEKSEHISEKAHSFLINWCWNSDNLHFYQTHGLNAIDDDIIKELSQWKPKNTIKLYRAVCDKKEELKYKNKLKSYFKAMEVAKQVLEDMGCESTNGYIEERIVDQRDVLVDMTLIPGYSDLDLIDEVIVINK